MLSRPRLGSGEADAPPEALAEPASGHAVVHGGVNTVVRVAFCGFVGSCWLLAGAVGRSRAREWWSFLRD
jgi:hypothetical protein